MHDSHGVLPADDEVKSLAVMLIDRKIDKEAEAERTR